MLLLTLSGGDGK